MKELLMKQIAIVVLLLVVSAVSVKAQRILDMQECRDLAIENNKNLKIAQEEINKAEFDQKTAFANYLPKVSVTGAYMHNSKELSLIDEEQDAALRNLGTTIGGTMTGSMAQMMQDPVIMSLIQSSSALQSFIANSGQMFSSLNTLGGNLADNFLLDTRNMYGGIISVQEPIYLGGKIAAYNKIASYKKELAQTQYTTSQQEIIVTTDQLYWQIVSLANKLKLTEKYVDLLRTMSTNVEKMANEGVATVSDKLSVRVKLNEAETTLLRVQNGLALSKMLLCQNCGLDTETDIILKDETLDDVAIMNEKVTYTEENILENRPELKSLDLAVQIYDKNVDLVRSDYLPSVAAFGNYVVTNPSMFNGFSNEFGGFWNVGVMAKIPVFHWGEGSNKIKKAKSDARIAQYKLDDAKEKIMLQVDQYSRQIDEAKSRMTMSEGKKQDAEENLRMATLGFAEGVIPSSGLTEAQTAWLKAHSEYIDSRIDWIMANVYLCKATGMLNK